jgi:1-phosphofructokinase
MWVVSHDQQGTVAEVIVTITLDPSIDRTIEVGALDRGAVHRAVGEHVHASGRGIDVTRALAAHGRASLALFPVGGLNGRLIVESLTDEGIDLVGVPVDAAARCTIAVREPDGTVTTIDTTGDPLSEQDITAVGTVLLDHFRHVNWVVAAGALPPGTADSGYAALIETVRSAGPLVAVDTAGTALATAVKASPDLLRLDHDQLRTAVGREPRTIGDIVGAARELRANGVGAVLACLRRDGAVLVDADGAWHGDAPTGGGAALLAGFLAAGARGPEALATALAWDAVAPRDTSVPGPVIDLARQLTGIR